MRTSAGFSWAMAGALLAGCGGSVEITSGSGGAGGDAGGAGTTTIATTGGGGASTTSTTSSVSTTSTTSTTATFADGCPDLPADAFWVDIQVGPEKFHLTSACPNDGDPYGPAAYAMTNGKSGPEWYFTIDACSDGIPQGSSAGPSVHVQATVPAYADVSTPYETTGYVGYVTSGQASIAPPMTPSIVFNQLGPEHTLVTGKLAGLVTWTDGQPVMMYAQFSVCRRSDVIYI